jgi:hypothetical protein
MARQLSAYCCTLLLHQDQRSRFHVRIRPLTWSPLTESNRRPSPYHGDALPTELRGRSRRIFRPARSDATGHDRLGEHTRPEITAVV